MIRRKFCANYICTSAFVAQSAVSSVFCSTASDSSAQLEFTKKFWSPINEQKQRTGLENVKEAAQKFQIIGHVQKLMLLQSQNLLSNNDNTSNNNNSLGSSSSSTSSVFTWTDVQTNHPQVVEDFLLFLTTGFDIKSVDCEKSVFVLEHSRNFLGWKPAPVAVSANTSAGPEKQQKEEEVVEVNPNLLYLPFSINFELQEVVPTLQRSTTSNESDQEQVVETETKFSKLKFDCPLVETLQKQTKCPEEVISCLSDGNRDPIKMVVALRKAGVRPEIISWRALKSATKKTSTWASALGVL
jgi:hypothetical protein